ncbi:MAG TPA: FlaD/FlaE family flagellar protein [Candidatus Thermoplasmatota archaeon]|nr:FlaD/FlaE family flagellar protein [Candidatus Thermoplasmatota archaeon]
MKIFGRGAKEETEKTAPAPPQNAKAEAAPAPEAAPAADPSQPDLAVMLDASVKDISEKIARLANSVETVHKERAGFDEKLKLMEDRMRKLSGLTEMMSSQYNPFVGDEPVAESAKESPKATATAIASGGGGGPGPMGAMASGKRIPVARDGGAGSAVAAPALHPLAAAAAKRHLDLEDEEDQDVLAARWTPRPAATSNQAPARLTRVARTFETSLLMMSWCDTLLKAASREGLDELLHYYQTIGWINDAVREEIENYANGIAVSEAPVTDWRANVDLHQRSLLYVEKLRIASAEPGEAGPA